MELKTLKDLPNPYEGRGEAWYSEIDLKKETIKWVKEFQKERTDAISEMFDNKDKYGIYPTGKFFNRIDNFWMKRLDITESDLK